MHNAYIALCLCLVFCNASFAQTSVDPETYLPSGSTVQGVGESLVVNGVPTKVVLFKSALAPDQFKRSIQDRFKQTFVWRAGFVGGLISATRVRDELVSIEIRPSGNGTSGRWTTAKVFSTNGFSKAAPPPWFPVNAQVIHQVESSDFDKQSQLIVGQTTEPMEAIALDLESSLKGAGFVQNTEIKRSWVGREHYANVFRHLRDEVSISITRDKQMTMIVMNRISALERLR